MCSDRIRVFQDIFSIFCVKFIEPEPIRIAILTEPREQTTIASAPLQLLIGLGHIAPSELFLIRLKKLCPAILA